MPKRRAAPALPRETVDRWVETYEQTPYRELPWFSPTAYPAVREAVRSRWFRGADRVLDVGCGAGTNALFLARAGMRASGVDLAPGAIRAARQRAGRAHLNVDFRVGNALELPYPARRFDGAIDVGCFHTFPQELRASYASEVARVLRPGASFVLSWIAKEYTGQCGPPNRLSVREVAEVTEGPFQFRWVTFWPRRGGSIPAYSARLVRR